MPEIVEPSIGPDVLILGAGFSRALSERMPLTDELGNILLDELMEASGARWLPRGGFSSGSYEAWLSSVAEDQPDLSAADNLERRALFARTVGLIHRVIRERESEALEAQPPLWLVKLARLAHQSAANIVSFNYDTLLDRAIDVSSLYDWENRRAVGYVQAIGGLPPHPNSWAESGTGSPTVSLHKIHGSLNWFWVPEDPSGASVVRTALGAWSTPADGIDDAERPPGREPFLIPPAAAKAAYYRNPIAREIWQRAARAIGTARRVALVGYSLPVTDLSASGLLERHLGSDCEVVVVNPEPDSIVTRLLGLGIPQAQITTIDGETSVASFVGLLEAEAQAQLAEQLRSDSILSPEAPMLMAWRPDHAYVITAVNRTDDHSVEVVCDPEARSLNVATLARHGSANPDLPPISWLTCQLKPGDRIHGRVSTGAVVSVIGAAHHGTDVGYSDRWHVLLPGG